MRLYEIIEEFKELEDMLYECGGELTPELEEMLSINRDNLRDKMEAMGKVIANLEGDTEACEVEIHRLNDLKYSKQRAIDLIRKRLLWALTEMGDRDHKGVFRVETPLFKFSTRKSEGVVIENELDIPKTFKIKEVVEKIDKNKIKDAIKAGKKVKGAILDERYNLAIR